MIVYFLRVDVSSQPQSLSHRYVRDACADGHQDGTLNQRDDNEIHVPLPHE